METKLHTFMVKVAVIIDEDDFNVKGYGLEFGTFGWQDSFVEVRNCMSLYQAILLVEGMYPDRNKYRTNSEESYMILDVLDFKKGLN